VNQEHPSPAEKSASTQPFVPSGPSKQIANPGSSLKERAIGGTYAFKQNAERSAASTQVTNRFQEQRDNGYGHWGLND
jgi:hypothetical protein